MKLLQLLHQHLCHPLMYTAVEIQRYIHLIPQLIPDTSHTLQHVFHYLVIINPRHLRRRIHLHRRISLLIFFHGRLGCVRRAVASDPAVHPHLILHRASKEIIDRHLVCLPLDIPQCLVNS